MNPTDLLTSAAVRSRCQSVYQHALADKLLHFSLSEVGLEQATLEVERVIRQRFPDLNIPPTSRWLHISKDRRKRLQAHLSDFSKLERARSNFDFIILSVLSDAGAGIKWRYQDSQQRTYSRSEGLAQAGFDGFIQGAFSSLKSQPFRVDAAALLTLSPQNLAAIFQVSDSNPITGLDGRAALLNRLGKALCDLHPNLDPLEIRPAVLLDSILRHENAGRVKAAQVLSSVLSTLGAIWPGRIERAGVNLGDTWIYPAFKSDNFQGLIPFHKLSQWLSYSLFEPLIEFGVAVDAINDLTALAEYRNGGLLLDCAAIVPRDSTALSRTYRVDDSLVIEWRALTVALIDVLAQKLRISFKQSDQELTIASVIEGGTWAAGREMALRLRRDGSSPILIDSDGTVF